MCRSNLKDQRQYQHACHYYTFYVEHDIRLQIDESNVDENICSIVVS